MVGREHLIKPGADGILQMRHVVPLARYRFDPVYNDLLRIQPNAVHNIERHALFPDFPSPCSFGSDVAVPAGISRRAMAPPELRKHRHALEVQRVLIAQPVETVIDWRKVQACGVMR